jgi:hypothetical protein
MKKTSLLAVVALVAMLLLLGAPYASWAAMTDDPDLVTVEIDMTASCEKYGAKGVFDYSFDFIDGSRPSYLTHVGDYWGDMLSPGSAVPPSEYPYLAVMMQVGADAGTRTEWYEPYTYGTALAWSGEYAASHGDSLRFQVQIYFAQSYSTYVSTVIQVT